MKVSYKIFDKISLEELRSSGSFSRVQLVCRELIKKGHDPSDSLEIYRYGINPNVDKLPDCIYSSIGKAAKDGGCRYKQYGVHYGPGTKLFNTQK